MTVIRPFLGNPPPQLETVVVSIAPWQLALALTLGELQQPVVTVFHAASFHPQTDPGTVQ